MKKRLPQLILIGSLLPLCWLGMMAVHELGHVLHAWFSGHYDLFYFVLVLTAVALVYLALERLRLSPFGRVLRSIREDETVAASVRPSQKMKLHLGAVRRLTACLRGQPLARVPR